jgi:hypothetical protein
MEGDGEGVDGSRDVLGDGGRDWMAWMTNCGLAERQPIGS